MKAHSEQYCLTPAYEPFYMIGYNSPLRELPAKGVHDDIFVTATLLDFGDQKLYLFSTDWLEVDDDINHEISEKLLEKFGIPPKLVLVSATHNHQSVRDHIHIVHGGHKALVVEAVASSPACDLFDLLRVQGALVHPVELAGLHKHDPPDGQV